MGRFEFEKAIASLANCRWCVDKQAAQQAECTDVLAQLLVSVNRPAEAEQAYFDYLAANPHAKTPDVAPKVAETFLSAKRRRYPPPSVAAKLVETQVPSFVEFVDPWALVSRIEVSDANQASPVALTVSQGRRAVLPTLNASTTYAVVLFDKNGLELFRTQRKGQTSAAQQASPWIITGGAVLLLTGTALVISGFTTSQYRSPTQTAAAIREQNETAEVLAVSGYVVGGLGLAAAATGVILRW
jgi:hypothetical protein